jgi:hypothetical protein
VALRAASNAYHSAMPHGVADFFCGFGGENLAPRGLKALKLKILRQSILQIQNRLLF